MSDVQRWLSVIYEAIDELNAVGPDDPPLEKSEATVLMGEGGRLDSLAIVRLIVSVEERVQDESGSVVALADERAFAQPASPFGTVGALAKYVDMLVEEAAGG